MKPIKAYIIFPPLYSNAIPTLGGPLVTGSLLRGGIDAEFYDLNKLFYPFVNGIAKERLIEYKKYEVINRNDITYLNWYDGYFDTGPIVCANYSNISKFLEDDIANLFLDFWNYLFREQVFDENNDKIYVFGFSLLSASQLLCALTAAKLLKDRYADCHIIFGGPFVSMFKDQIAADKLLFENVDYIVIGDGEYTILDIIKRIQSNQEDISCPNKLSGVLYSFKDKFDTYFPRITKDPFDEFILPEFSNLEGYSSHYNCITYLTARGCFWGNCKFCCHLSGYSRSFEPKSINTIIAELEQLQNQYQYDYIYFCDASISPRRFSDLSEAILKSKLKPFKWWCFGFIALPWKKEHFKIMKMAGCDYIDWGLETADIKLSQAIGKPQSKDIFYNVIDAISTSGIRYGVQIIYDFPGESIAQTNTSLEMIDDFMRRYSPTGFPFTFMPFKCFKMTPFYEEYHRCGLEYLDINNNSELRYLDYLVTPKNLDICNLIVSHLKKYKHLYS